MFVPHATAGIAIIETGAGSDEDLLAALADLLLADDRWRHRHGTPGHGRSHVTPALIPPYATVPVVDGRLALGTWQSICLVDVNVDNTERRGAVLPQGGLKSRRARSRWNWTESSRSSTCIRSSALWGPAA